VVLFENEGEINKEKLDESIKKSGLSPLIDNLEDGL